MDARIFDTHTFVKKLKTSGLTEEQAEIQAQALIELLSGLETSLATQHQVEDVKTSLQARIEQVRVELHDELVFTKKELHDELVLTKKELEARIEQVKLDLNTRIDKMEMRLTIRMGAMSVAAVGVMSTLMRIL